MNGVFDKDKIKIGSVVLLKSGKEAEIMEFLGPDTYIADIQTDEMSWETISVELIDIIKIVQY